MVKVNVSSKETAIGQAKGEEKIENKGWSPILRKSIRWNNWYQGGKKVWNAVFEGGGEVISNDGGSGGEW